MVSYFPQPREESKSFFAYTNSLYPLLLYLLKLTVHIKNGQSWLINENGIGKDKEKLEGGFQYLPRN